MMEKLLLFLIILFASCLNNLIIPYAIFIKKFGIFKKRSKGFVGVGIWGIIMDGIIAGLINVTALNFLLEIKPGIFHTDILTAIVAGFISMIAIHIFMSVRRWKVWIMSKPWNWNAAGYWHMISTTIQMSFLFYPLVVTAKNPSILNRDITIISLILIFLLTILFIIAFHFDNKGLRIGKLHLSNKSW